MQQSRVRVSSLPPFRLDLGSAAVNEQFDTCYETVVIRSQKQRHLSNFPGVPHVPHRDGGHNPRNHVWRLPASLWKFPTYLLSYLLPSTFRKDGSWAEVAHQVKACFD